MQQINTFSMPEINLVGLTTRTCNSNEQNPSQDKILPLLKKYFSNSFSEKIFNRKNPNTTFIAYTDYESNYTGEYICLIGEETTKNSNQDNSLDQINIPNQSYMKFTSEVGPLPEIVINLWNKIWEMKEIENRRRYIADFEVYDHRSIDPSNSIVDIYIGVK